MKKTIGKKANKFRVFFNWITNAGVTYYRMMNPAKYMRKQKNVEVAMNYFKPEAGQPPAWESHILLDRKVTNKVLDDFGNLTRIADISVWQTCHNDMSLAMFFTMRELFPDKKILMELDDYVFGVNAENLGSESYYPGSIPEDIVKRQMINSSGLIVSTKFLKDKYSEFNRHIEIIPNGLDFEIWDKVKNNNKNNNKSNKRVRVGWSGGQAHIRDLKVICKAIPKVLERDNNIEFMFFGGYPDSLISESERVKFHKVNDRPVWVSIDKYPAELASLGFDIGIAPLRDNDFNRAKSNLRWLEYSALKIPTIASPVGEFKDIPKPMIYANEVDDWVEKICLLAKSERVRKHIGLASYKNVRHLYDVKNIADKYTKVLKKFNTMDLNKDIIFETHREKMFPEAS